MSTNNDEFWGKHGDWPEAPEGTRREPRAGVGTTVSRWWNNVLGGGSTGNRAHGGRYAAVAPIDLDDEPLNINPSGEHPVVRPSGEQPVTRRDGGDPTGTTPRPESDRTGRAAQRSALSNGGISDEWDEEWEVETFESPPTPSKPGVDPLLARLGGAVIVLTLVAPLVLGVGSGDDEPAANAAPVEPAITLFSLTADTVPISTTPVAVVASAGSTDAAATAPVTVTLVPVVTTTVAAASPDTAPLPAADQPPQATQAPTTGELATGAAASGTAERAQSCAIDYTVVAGDFWIRLADSADVPLEQLLDANDATTDTPLYPGSTICLPEGSNTPSPPNTAAAATTVKPVTTSPATTPPATTPTTVKPVVTYPTPSAAAVQQIIRDVWPDELEDRAIEIAARESNFIATAQNSCCYGIFQIHWNSHKSWLAGLGITRPDQLFDVTNNAYAAYALYQRSGGWGPWT